MEKLTSKLSTIDFKPTGLVEKFSETLAEAILEGVFKEGDQLIEVDLQKQLASAGPPSGNRFGCSRRKVWWRLSRAKALLSNAFFLGISRSISRSDRCSRGSPPNRRIRT